MYKFSKPEGITHEYAIQRPDKKRSKFRILKRERVDGRYKSTTVKHKTLDKINKALASEKIDLAHAEKAVNDLKEKLLQEDGALIAKEVFNNENQEILFRFWDKKYKSRKIASKKDAWLKFYSAVRDLGKLSLMTATQEEIQTQIDGLGLRPNIQIKRMSALRTLLAYVGRGDLELHSEKSEYIKIVYLNDDQLAKVLPYLPTKAFRVMVELAYWTGMRIGELLALDQDSLKKNGVINCAEQLTREGKISGLKSQESGFSRDIYAFDRAIELFGPWMILKNEIDLTTRLSAANILRDACRRAKVPSIRFHQLRHSFAVKLAAYGFELSTISKNLGNTEEVCFNHYSRFIIADDMVDRMRRRIQEVDRESKRANRLARGKRG